MSEIRVWMIILIAICMVQSLIIGWALGKIRELVEREGSLMETALSALRSMKIVDEKLQSMREGRRE